MIQRNTAINLVGQALPIGFAAVAIPTLIRLIGLERFGVLSLTWVVLGYAGLLDLGLARATAKLTADAIAKAQRLSLGSIVRASLLLHALLGASLGLIFALLQGTIASRVVNPPPRLLDETAATLGFLAVALPFVVVSNGARSILEGAQRFDLVNAVWIPTSALTYGLPMLGAAAGLPLPALVLLLVLNRCATALIYVALALARVPEAITASFQLNAVRGLFGFGRWVAISNVFLPGLVYGDRFVASSMLGVATIGYYSAPSDAITRLWVVPAAVTQVIFPALSRSVALGNGDHVRLYADTLRRLLVVLGPILWAAVLVSAEVMRGWLGPVVGGEAAPLLRILATGVLAGTLGYMPVTLLQGIGRPDLPAKLQVAQLAPFLLLAGYLVATLGLVGAALAWTARTVVDLMLGLFLVDRTVGRPNGMGRTAAWTVLFLVITAALATPVVQSVPFAWRSALAAASVAIAGAIALRVWIGAGQSER
jgi:O-antigen/teichoic acid export membrane protein